MSHPNLPVKSTIADTMALVKDRFPLLLKAAIPLVLANLVFAWGVGNPEHIPGSGVSKGASIFLFVLIQGLATVVSFVGFHRVFLLTKEEAAERGAFHWSQIELRFLGWCLLMGLLAVLLSIPMGVLASTFITLAPESAAASLTSYLLYLLMSLPFWYLLARWSLVLPATAINYPRRSLGWAWELSANNSGKLFILLGVIPLFTSIVYDQIPIFDLLLLRMLVELAWIPVLMFEVGLLSASFDFLSSNVALEDAESDSSESEKDIAKLEA